jgi:serine protease AprX
MKNEEDREKESLKRQGWEEASISKLDNSLVKKISESKFIGSESESLIDVIIQIEPSKEVGSVLEESINNLNENKRAIRENFKEATRNDKNLEEVYNYVSSIVKPEANVEEVSSDSGIEKNLFTNSIRTLVTPEQLQEIVVNNKIIHIESNDMLIPEIEKSLQIINIMNARKLKNTSLSGKNIKVGIVDSEIDDSHTALKHVKITKTNLSNEELGNPAKHGTHVAGIIASNDSNFGGISPNVSIHNFKVFPAGRKFEGIKAIELGVNEGCHVLNLSFGVPSDNLNGSSTICTAVDNAVKLGVCVIKSAGNNGTSGKSSITSPADAKEVLTVGSVNSDGSNVAWFSSLGPTADHRHVPHICAPGENIMSTVPGNRFDEDSGTSMAAPHITGIVALVLEANPNLTPSEIKKIFQDTAQKIKGSSDLDAAGNGLIDAEKAISKALEKV